MIPLRPLALRQLAVMPVALCEAIQATGLYRRLATTTCHRTTTLTNPARLYSAASATEMAALQVAALAGGDGFEP